MRLPIRIVATCIAAALCATPALAQTAAGHQGFGLGFAGGYYSLGGDDFETTDAGFGFEVSGRFHLSPTFVLLGGYGMSWHDESYIDETVTDMRVSLEPRFLFVPKGGGSATPFIGGRAGWTRASATVGGSDASQSGFYFAGVGGLMVQMSPQMMFEAEVMFGSISFGDAKADGETIPDSDASGSFLALQLGIVYHFGSR